MGEQLTTHKPGDRLRQSDDSQNTHCGFRCIGRRQLARGRGARRRRWRRMPRLLQRRSPQWAEGWSLETMLSDTMQSARWDSTVSVDEPAQDRSRQQVRFIRWGCSGSRSFVRGFRISALTRSQRSWVYAYLPQNRHSPDL